ncbi:MAG TPA: hypothetical protein VNW97_05860 [Candidatus Saccharimonadales bacterium]|nr:hypothetical protein [Candidatus Saccharimonadales bacterium]
MSQAAQETRTAQEVIRDVRVTQSANGVCYATAGEISLPSSDLENLVNAVPRVIAAALSRKAFYFVPLAVQDGEQTLVPERYDSSLIDQAACHCNIDAGDAQCVFISTRLLNDRFSIAFEFYINVSHAFVETAGVSQEFAELAWKQATGGVRGETSVDACEFRKQALGQAAAEGEGRIDEKARTSFVAAAFADSVAIYLLSLYLDVDYYELREREYSLLAPAALAERLRKIAELFPPGPGFQFNLIFRRRG